MVSGFAKRGGQLRLHTTPSAIGRRQNILAAPHPTTFGGVSPARRRERPTEEVWDSSRRIEEKLDNLRRLQKRQHRTVMASFAVLALLLIAGIIWFKSSTEKIVTDPEILRTKLEEKIKQSFERKHQELVARKATPAEMDQLYRLQEGALKQVSESVRFIQSTTKDAQATIAKKAVQIVQEDGVDRALKYLDQTISDEARGHKERARELAEASLLKAELQLNKLDYDGAQSAIKQAIDLNYKWWEPHNRLGLLFYRKAQWNAAEAEFREAQRFVDSEENTATILNNLAPLLKATNRLAEAEPLMRRALEIDEKSFGPEHPKVAIRPQQPRAIVSGHEPAGGGRAVDAAGAGDR